MIDQALQRAALEPARLAALFVKWKPALEEITKEGVDCEESARPSPAFRARFDERPPPEYVRLLLALTPAALRNSLSVVIEPGPVSREEAASLAQRLLNTPNDWPFNEARKFLQPATYTAIRDAVTAVWKAINAVSDDPKVGPLPSIAVISYGGAFISCITVFLGRIADRKDEGTDKQNQRVAYRFLAQYADEKWTPGTRQSAIARFVAKTLFPDLSPNDLKIEIDRIRKHL